MNLVDAIFLAIMLILMSVIVFRDSSYRFKKACKRRVVCHPSDDRERHCETRRAGIIPRSYAQGLFHLLTLLGGHPPHRLVRPYRVEQEVGGRTSSLIPLLFKLFRTFLCFSALDKKSTLSFSSGSALFAVKNNGGGRVNVLFLSRNSNLPDPRLSHFSEAAARRYPHSLFLISLPPYLAASSSHRPAPTLSGSRFTRLPGAPRVHHPLYHFTP
jgi:hypothetical protein